jgi:hypothetical protein
MDTTVYPYAIYYNTIVFIPYVSTLFTLIVFTILGQLYDFTEYSILNLIYLPDKILKHIKIVYNFEKLLGLIVLILALPILIMTVIIMLLIKLIQKIITRKIVEIRPPAYSVNNPTVLELEVVLTISANAIVVFDVDNQCQECDRLFIVEVVVTDGSNAGMFIHNQYNYYDSTIPYSSPLQSNQVTFALPSSNPLVSYYDITVGNQGQGSFPYPGVDMNLYTDKIGFDNFDVAAPPNRFLYTTSNI